ncbi:hypothetical protein CMV_019009 [Castanea mollissima]|uniref:Uncharacterized protein n=1 Tax=Castanea mollissima TaxID=60419 RepID=A0A8J4VH50_9ROSI|nr:hypothetical protein CMV_019009 [Castanea mollissima]
MASQAELVKIGLEGFAIIDKYYGRPRRSGTGRPYYPPPRQVDTGHRADWNLHWRRTRLSSSVDFSVGRGLLFLQTGAGEE